MSPLQKDLLRQPCLYCHFPLHFLYSVCLIALIVSSLQKTQMLGKIEGRKRRDLQTMRRWHHWLGGHEFEQTLGDSEGQGAWRAVVHGVAKSRTRLSNWTTNDRPLAYEATSLPVYCISCPSHSPLEYKLHEGRSDVPEGPRTKCGTSKALYMFAERTNMNSYPRWSYLMNMKQTEVINFTDLGCRCYFSNRWLWQHKSTGP